MPDQDTEVVYHGYQQLPAGGSVIALETSNGETIGLLHHYVRHSPTGFQWGYAGSGPAETARCLLLAAVDDPHCPTCAGTHHTVIRDNGTERPFQPDCDNPNAENVVTCMDCDTDGLRRLPYQEFKWNFVAGWDSQWFMRRSEIRKWLIEQGVTP